MNVPAALAWKTSARLHHREAVNWPSEAPYRIYNDRVGETKRFTCRPNHEWYWFPRQKPNKVSMLKCYDSVTDGSTSRWSFHTACIDPTAPATARCRKNVVVRSFVFF
jgi:hypothetical protein